jgi:hypothetical protein
MLVIMPYMFGKEKAIAANLPTTANLDSLVKTNSSRNHSGSGNISRKENIKTEIAAVVAKVLPNGNLVIQGHQEVRVNYELREIKVAGIIRPKDITSDNSIRTNQMAEARISYGGRGVVSDVQQPRAGAQVIDILSPFKIFVVKRNYGSRVCRGDRQRSSLCIDYDINACFDFGVSSWFVHFVVSSFNSNSRNYLNICT